MALVLLLAALGGPGRASSASAPPPSPVRGGGAAAPITTPHVDVLHFVGDIGPVSARLITTSLAAARSDGAAAFVLELDTPGGSLDAMRTIAQAFLNSPLPTIVYVAPAGARAGSAGTFVTYAAQLAGMAPGTEIGAAHPVGSQGANLSSVENEKVTNDAVAMITAWARKNGRNATWAEQAVRQAASLPASQAVAMHVVNVEAPDLPALLRALDGQTAHLASRDVAVHLAGARIVHLGIPWWTRLLLVLANPTLAYLLFTLGFWALVAEFSHPTLFTGVLGGMAILLGLLGMEILSARAEGVVLLVVGLALLLIDIKAPTHGVLSAGGVIAFVIGSLLLFQPVAVPGGSTLGLSPWAVAGAGALAAGFGTAVALGIGRRRHRPAAAIGAQGLEGRRGRVTAAVGPRGTQPGGQVEVGGSYWPASWEGPGELAPGTEVVVDAVDGLHLQVRPKGDGEAWKV